MATFTWTSDKNQGIIYDGTFKFDDIEFSQNINNLPIVVTSLSDDGFSVYIEGGYEINYKLKDIKSTGYTASIGKLEFSTSKFGILWDSGEVIGNLIVQDGSEEVTGYATKSIQYYHDDGIKEVIEGAFDYSKIKSGDLEGNFQYLVSGNDTFNGTNKDDKVASG